MNAIVQSRTTGPEQTSADSRKTTLEFNKLHKRLRREVGRAIEDFKLIEHGDRVMVALSGGADSHTLLDILLDLQRSAPVEFSITAVNLDQKQPGFPAHVLPDYLESRSIDYHILEQDTYSVVKRVVPEGKTMCGLCSRLRRGALYTFAAEQGYNRIALGHHADDMLETLFLNMFYGGKIKTMPAKLKSDDGRNMVIRPLAYCRENDIKAYAQARKFPIIPCTLCGSQDNMQRQVIKQMLNEWEKRFPGRIETLLASLQNVIPSHLLDKQLFDFAGLELAAAPADHVAGQPEPGWVVPRNRQKVSDQVE